MSDIDPPDFERFVLNEDEHFYIVYNPPIFAPAFTAADRADVKIELKLDSTTNSVDVLGYNWELPLEHEPIRFQSSDYTILEFKSIIDVRINLVDENSTVSGEVRVLSVDFNFVLPGLLNQVLFLSALLFLLVPIIINLFITRTNNKS